MDVKIHKTDKRKVKRANAKKNLYKIQLLNIEILQQQSLWNFLLAHIQSYVCMYVGTQEMLKFIFEYFSKIKIKNVNKTRNGEDLRSKIK